MRFSEIALQVPRVLLPRPDVAVETWAVIACDQHTSDPQYWRAVDERVGSAPSTLRLVLPEVYLEAADRPARIAAIRRAMERYLAQGVLVDQPPGFVLVDRSTPHVASRRGLIAALDLEHYSWAADAHTLIRTTEGTVLERIPPRVEIRRGAPLECPHILVLIDDPERTVIEPLFEGDLEPLYDAQLMLGGGRVRGWRAAGDGGAAQVGAALARLARGQSEPFLYAMGDGNHSFATARAVWDQIKAAAGGLAPVAEHPARHALVEVVNLHDEGLIFEPIHRALFHVDLDGLLAAMDRFYREQGSPVTVETFADRAAWERARAGLDESDDHHLPFVAGARRGICTVHRPVQPLEAVSLQAFLSGYEAAQPAVEVDYIHGEGALERLAARPGTVGLYSQALDKGDLFATIRRQGPLPRKSFSLGEAEEKRYYLECRRLRA